MIEIKKEMVPHYSFEKFEDKILWRDGFRYLELKYMSASRVTIRLIEDCLDEEESIGCISINIDDSNGTILASVPSFKEEWYSILVATLTENCLEIVGINKFYFEECLDAVESISKTLIRYLKKIRK